MTPLSMGLLGLFLGPVLHGLAVQAGSDRSLHAGLTCPQCGEDATWTSLRCVCRRLRWREVAVTVLTGAAFGWVAAAVGWRPVLAAHLAMVAITVILIITDLDHFRIPNRILYPGTLLVLLLLLGAAGVEGDGAALAKAVAGGAIYFGLLFLVFLAARGDGFGFGDVKLAALLGLNAGYHGFRTLAWSLVLTAVLGAIPAFVLLAMGRGRKAYIPYGPALILGTWGAIALAGRL